MARIQAQGVIGELSQPRRRGTSSLFPGRTRNGPDENQAAEKLPMP